MTGKWSMQLLVVQYFPQYSNLINVNSVQYALSISNLCIVSHWVGFVRVTTRRLDCVSCQLRAHSIHVCISLSHADLETIPTSICPGLAKFHGLPKATPRS